MERNIELKADVKLAVTSEGIDEIRIGFDIFIHKMLNFLKMLMVFDNSLLTSQLKNVF